MDLPPVEIRLSKSEELHSPQTEYHKPDETIGLEGKKMIPRVPAATAAYAEEVFESEGVVEELIASDRNEIAVKIKRRPKRNG